MTIRNKYATLFGGAMNITDSPEYLDTVKIGKLLAEQGYIVKNGGYGGMMEAVSKGVYEAGGKSIGYTCETFQTTVGNQYLSTTLPREDIYDRLKSLISNSELFIVQKGGLGTLAELFLTLDILRKLQTPPKVVLIGRFWLSIMEALEVLISKKERKLFIIVDNYEAFKELIWMKEG